MANGVLMPKAGITVESCIIGKWRKAVGDRVAVGDILFDYETDKASFECESTAEGELLEIFTNDSGGLVFKKYNEVGATPEQLDAISKVLYKNTGKEVAICDTSSILAHVGGKEGLQGEDISDELYGVLDNRKSRLIKDRGIRLVDDMQINRNSEQYIVPLISSGDLYGGIILSAEKLGAVDMALCDAMAGYLTYNIG